MRIKDLKNIVLVNILYFNNHPADGGNRAANGPSQSWMIRSTTNLDGRGGGIIKEMKLPTSGKELGWRGIKERMIN